MRERHPCFEQPVLPDAVLWRYMDFPKFVSMLHERALYFCRSDVLGDPLEGSLTQAVEVARQARLANPPEGRTREELMQARAQPALHDNQPADALHQLLAPR